MHPDYSAHGAFVSPARPRAEPWRLVVGLIMAAVIYIGLVLAIDAIALATLSDDGYFRFRTMTEDGNSPAGTLYLLGSFAFLSVAISAVAHRLHKRSPLTLLGPPGLALRQGWLVLRMLALVLLAIWMLPPAGWPTGLVPQHTLGTWVLLLPLALPVLLLQTSAEELVFRGYVQQQLAARFGSPWIWMLVPALLFGLLHYRPDAGPNAWLFIGWAAAFSLAASDLTARAGTLGPAIALHVSVNAWAILVFSQDDTLSGLSLYHLPIDLADPETVKPLLLTDLGVLFVSWLAARLALRR
ncbi:CPBP family intramembrane glutamic endopeptidase [Thalassovita aquimarina]|uniref:CPBP family intramembrane metalloprotease n=1 Tax=Thalassovita aquimarina TaxID=2785917 RepID=A0ABS5HTZ7_9RHOB|nr:type II CAAX endopeptidase family protein [Thalassovita aquimarina]MBR9652400.1 CPBP family intramembrane metalloprotease [Thalassovita aquimarina]